MKALFSCNNFLCYMLFVKYFGMVIHQIIEIFYGGFGYEMFHQFHLFQFAGRMVELAEKAVQHIMAPQ